MRRADRLFQIVQYLRSRRLTTAAQLAGWLEVSERTIYRDVQDLQCSGVPVEGEAGVGYRIAKSFDLPPLMFTLDEVEALVAGARMAAAWSGPALAAASRSAVAKITLALPPDKRQMVESTRLFAPNFHIPREVGERLEVLRQATSEHIKLALTYRDQKGTLSERCVRPVGLHFWGSAWTMAAWCEWRADFRNFRLDRIETIHLLTDQRFDEREHSLADFLRSIGVDPSTI